MKAIAALCSALVFCSLGGCNSNSNPAAGVTSQMIGASGGTLSAPQLGGATLLVPPGALAQPTLLSVSAGQSAAQAGETALAPTLHFEPAGMAFNTPVTLTLPYQLGALPSNSEVIIAAVAQGQRSDLPGGLININSQAGTIAVNVNQLSDYQAIATGKLLPPLNKDVDILFMIDNSPSMYPKQQALAQNIPKFIQSIAALGVNYQIAITTSDVGSWTAPGVPWTIAISGCASYAGDDGLLQRVPCTARQGLSMAAQTACQTLCPPGNEVFLPAAGAGFISSNNGVTNVPSMLVNGLDLGPQNAFKCMALVGDAGCGIEGQLEGAKRALDGHLTANAGFLRPNSLLALVFITDEDDCSVQASRRAENDPATVECATPDQSAAFNCYNADYRCLARDVQCDQPMNQTGAHTNCSERPDSYLESVASYVGFFAGLRPTNRLLVSGIWTLPAADRGGPVSIDYQTAPDNSDELNRSISSDAGCVYVNDPSVYGRPQLRLSKLARNFNGSQEVSICDVNNYPSALDNIAAAIASKMGG